MIACMIEHLGGCSIEARNDSFCGTPAKRRKLRLKFVIVILIAIAALISFAALPRRHAEEQSAYRIIDLGTLGGGESEARGINDLGEIVGDSENAMGQQHAFLWVRGMMTDLITLPDGYYHTPNSSEISHAFSINDQSEIVGDADLGLANGTGRGIYHAVAWVNGKPNDLGQARGYQDSSATIINAQGLIAGQGLDDVDPTQSGYRACSVYFAQGITHPTGALPNGFTINDRGQSLGSIRRGAYDYLVLWKNTRIEMQSRIPGTKYLLCSALNNRGQAVVDLTNADSEDPSDSTFSSLEAALWMKGKLHPLAALPGYPNTYASDINDSDQIVGWAGEAYSEKRKQNALAVMWEGGSVRDLNRLIPQDSGWVLHNATASNNRGQIVGYGSHNGKEGAFLLTPAAISASNRS